MPRIRGETARTIGSHAGIMDTSVAMAVDSRLVRPELMAPGDDVNATGVLGDPSRTRAAYGQKGLGIQITDAVARIKDLTGAPR